MNVLLGFVCTDKEHQVMDDSSVAFKDMSTGKVNFLQFSGLLTAIKKYMQPSYKMFVKCFSIRHPSTIELIFKSKKACKNMYNVLISKENTVFQLLKINGLKWYQL